ncbi:MAG: DNA internalization-related competence protein ComEC/Rec2 [Gammaproteobacteria bacterium]|nr:DNA internalization-related competence protein ComEC/Rec2 [Gammaproteobacteria bacterium]
MQIASIGFLVGVLICQHLAALPALYWLLISCVVIPVIVQFPKLRLLSFALLGFLYAAFVAHEKIADQFDPTLEGIDLLLSGVVASLPNVNANRTQFQLDVLSIEKLNSVEPAIDLNAGFGADAPMFRILLSWYRPEQQVHVGERWQFVVRLKRPRGFTNPGGFDYEAWLFQQDIVAKGYVVQRQGTKKLNRYVQQDISVYYALHRSREYLRDQLRLLMNGSYYSGFVIALTVGDRQGLTPEHWNVLTRTGTNHLMAISGLHIGLIAGLMYFAGARIWRYIPGAIHRLPAPKAGAALALLAAFGYAALAGFAIPTQRAFVMVAVVMSMIWLQREMAPSRTLSIALIAVLVFDPMAAINAGFWLSFCAVAVILYAMAGRLPNTGFWWKWGRVQWVITVGLAPVLIFVFQNVPIVSPLANFIAVPWVSMVTIPLSLLGSVLAVTFPGLAASILQLAELSLAVLWPLLSALSGFDVLQWAVDTPPSWAIIPAVIGILWLLAPKGLPARWLGLVWLAPLIYATKTPLPYGVVQFTLLDVGQGLAAVIQTQHHVLVYDTGPRFSQHFDTGSAVIVPFLKTKGINTIDVLILSHDDLDHTGGYESINERVMVDKVLATQAVKTVERRWEWCRRGLQWHWDGVIFRVIHPNDGYKAMKDNNYSCVLQIVTRQGSVLLTGDIEQLVENRLLQTANQSGQSLQAQVLVVPHHGSTSSSSESFLQAVRPKYALFSVGYRNRYGLPKNEIVERYRNSGAKLFDTSSSGAISFTMGDTVNLTPVSYRQENQRYWHQ